MKKIIEKFVPQGGRHCITNSLKQIFSYYGYPISEEMMFGLASGLSFLYLNQSNAPMVNGRIKIFVFEKKLAERLNIVIRCRSGKNYDKVSEITRHMIDKNEPVLIYVDMPYLNYLGMNESGHFGGHAVVLFGYDDDEKNYYISDRDHHEFPIRTPQGTIAEDYHLVGYEEIRKARSSTHRPFPAGNKYLTFDFGGFRGVGETVLREAIRETCDSMLNPPAQLLGLNGILKFSREVKKWKSFDPEKLRLAGTINYFQISRDGGTGGGIFRNMYGEFLIEAASVLKDARLTELGRKFIEVSHSWDQVADDLWQLSLHGSIELLERMSDSILVIYKTEKHLYTDLTNIVNS